MKEHCSTLHVTTPEHLFCGCIDEGEALCP